MRAISREETPRPTRVVIVGGGAAAVVTAVHLVRATDDTRPVDVRIVERGPRLGPGLAYTTTHPRHQLNNFAGRLSAVDQDPDHLLRWCARHGIPAEPTSFLPRKLYGRYLEDVLSNAAIPAGSSVGWMRGLVTDVLRAPDGRWRVEVSHEGTVTADRVVLALGIPPPRRDRALERLGVGYVGDPWVRDLPERLDGVSDVLLLGTGLTMLDVVGQLHDTLPMTRFTAVSRHGLLPTAHRRTSLRLHDTFHPGQGSLDVVLGAIHARIEEMAASGGDWRDVIDSVRASANDLWNGFTPAEQQRFVDDIARSWDVARHRMPPDLADLTRDLRRSGRLRVRRTSEVDPARFGAVVNCTGPAPVPTRGWNPLVDRLLDRGTIRPNRLGLGLDLDADGQVVGEHGTPASGLFAVGWARRGVEWEVTAIPDLRSQATRLAAHLFPAVEQDQPAARSSPQYGVLA